MKWEKMWDKVKEYLIKILLGLVRITVSFLFILLFAFFTMSNVVLYKWCAIFTILGYLICGLIEGIVIIFMIYYLIYVWENRKLTGYISYVKSLNQTK